MKTTTRSWLAMIVIGIFTIMANLDASIINIALPIMSNHLRFQLVRSHIP